MFKRRIGFAIVTLILALGLGYAIGSHKTSDTTLVINTYTVPVEQAEDLRQGLNNLLSNGQGKASDGNIQLMNNSLLVVKTTQTLQKDISKFIAEFTKTTKDKMAIKIEYWLVTAPVGAPVATTIEQLTEAFKSPDGHENKNFAIVDHLRIDTMEKENTEIKGGSAELKVESPMVVNGHIRAKVRVQTDLGKMDAELNSMDKGLLIVSSGKPIIDTNQKNQNTAKQVFHVFRTSVIP